MRVHVHNLGFYLENFSAYSDGIAKCVDIYTSMFSFRYLCRGKYI